MQIWRIHVREQKLSTGPVPTTWERLGGRGLLARMLLDEVARRYHIPLSEDEEYDTLGGFIFGRLEKKPKVGDVLELPGHTLEIAEVDGLRIRRVRLRIKEEAHSSQPVQ